MVYSTTMDNYFLLFLLSIHLQLANGCQDSPVGVADPSIIPDDRFTATSEYDSRYAAKNARLNGAGRGWGPKTKTNPNDYLQIDLGKVFVICAVATQGCNGWDEWTTQYNISTAIENTTWSMYTEDGTTTKLFTGNTDRSTIVKNALRLPVQARYIRFTPTTYNSWKVLRVEVYGVMKGVSCRSLPVGIASAKIPDGDMTSSSAYNITTSPSKARLNYTAGSSWCAATSDSSPYLQINLGSPYIICGIATQGDHMTDQWVQSYNMLTSSNGSTFTKYTERSLVKTFSGSFDSDTIVKNLLYDGTTGQYLRIAPISHYGTAICLRTELYGIQHTGGCSSISVGLSYPSTIPDHRFTASSFYDYPRYRPSNGRLLSARAWGPKTASSGNWLQIDLGSLVYVCVVATQGGGKMIAEFVERYKISVSLDNVYWNYYQENNIDKEFVGNTERYAVVTKALSRPTKAKFLRFYPTAYNGWPTMKAEVYGISSACSSPFGIELEGVLQDSQMTSSSHLDNTHTASRSRLYGDSSWCSGTSSNAEYIQIDLGQVMTVTGIATQGDHTMDKWVTTYTISYSMDGNLWNTYKAGGNSDKVLQGNADKSAVVVRWLSHPYSARHIRVTPQTWNTSICMRIELYGCSYATRPVISGLTNQNLAAAANSYVDLVCIVQEPLIQYIKWYTGNTDITSQSTGLVHGANGVKKSTLRVNYTSADDFVNTYHCKRSASVVCRKPYVCRAMFKKDNNAADAVQSAGVTVILDYPATLAIPTLDNIASTAVTVRWTQSVTRPSQARVTSYVVLYQNSTSTQTINMPSPALSHVITGLSIYSNYSVKIKAVSGVGHGEWSQLKNFTTLSALPVAVPKAVAVKASSSRSLLVTWQAPTTGINGPLQGYKIIYASIQGNDDTTVVIGGQHTSHLINSLRKWKLYRIKINVFNDKGDGPSSTVVARTLEDAPSLPPQQLVVNILSSTFVRLSWRLPPRESRNGVIRGFKVYYQKSSGRSLIKNIPGNDTLQCFVDGLDKYTSYSFKVLAYTIRDGPYSQSITARTGQDAPSPPLNLQASVIPPNNTTGPHVHLTWDVPEFPNGVIENYVVSYSHNDSLSVLSKASVTGSVMDVTLPVIGGLTYWFRVRAVTVKDGNDTSARQVFIPIYAPSIPPSIIEVTKQDPSHFVVSWQPIPRDKANGLITKYEVTWTLIMRSDKSVNTVSSKEINGSKTVLENLAMCAKYTTSVRGYTSAGPGPYSTPYVFYTSAPERPVNVIVTFRDKRELTLQWTKPGSVAEVIRKYTIYFLGTKRYNNTFIHRGTRVTSNPLPKFTVQHLYPDTHYEFGVSASSKCGEGENSVKISTDTLTDAPPAPLARLPLGTFNTSITNVTIWPASDVNGKIRAYQLVVRQLDKSSIEATKLTDYSTAKETDLHYYITAEISSNIGPFPQVFPLGNGKFYGKYENVKLDSGKKYEVLERALTQDKEKSMLPGPMVVIAKGSIVPTDGTKDRLKEARGADSQIPLVGYSIIGVLCILIILLLFYIARIKRTNRTLKAEKRLSQKSGAGETVLENAVVMEDRRYTSEDISNSPPAITEDVYEQVDQRCGPCGMTSSPPDQDFTMENTYAAVDLEDNTEANDDQPPPLPPINDEEYEEIDRARETLKRGAQYFDPVKRPAVFKFAQPGSAYNYEDMNAATVGRPMQVKKNRKENEGNFKEVERPDYQPLQLDTAQSEYKELHNYDNIGRSDHKASFS